MPGTILLVEDNPFTRKMVRFALEKRGHSVLEAEDGRTALSLFESGCPDLVLQDLVLPDVDGFDLVTRLRALPRGDKVAILAFSGLVSKLEEARIATVGFDDVIVKPIEPSRLIPIIEAHLLAPAVFERIGESQRLVLADDDPIQLKLTRFRLERVGFWVDSASDGQQALEAALRQRPDGIVADVLMPRLDGFGLALAVRKEPRLAEVPVLLVTSSYVDDSDRDFARRAGANDLIVRTPNQRELLESLRRILRDPLPVERAVSGRLPELEKERSGRVVHQLERQVTLNTGLARRVAALSAELTVLAAISEAVVRHQDIEQALDEAVAACLDIGGISVGALYLFEPGGPLRVRSVTGAGAPEREELCSFFGKEEILRSAIAPGNLLLVPSASLNGEWAEALLRKCEATFAMIVPLVHRGGSAGALFMAVKSEEFDQDWDAFARGIGNQIAQALALAGAFAEKERAERHARDQAELLRQSDERFRATFEQAAVGVAHVTLDGRWLDVNQRLCDIVGYERAELLARTLQDITFPADVDVDLELVRKMLAGEIRTYTLEKRYIRKDSELVWIDLTVSLVRDDTGAPIYFISVIQDISARKTAEAELEKTSAQLRHAQKMEAIGQLAGGIAHDFNNLLSVVLSYAELLLADLHRDDPMHESLEQIVEASHRAANLTRQLLVFSRHQVLSPQVLNLNDVCNGLSKMLARLIGEDIELSLQLASTSKVHVDPSHMEQVIMNLLVNARDAMPTGGKLVVATADVDLGQEHVCDDIDIAPGRHIMLSVTDTGTGIDPAIQPRIFEPFFTTKGPGQGTGLGLSTAFGIVKQSGGSISVCSQPGSGTTFKVYLPVADESQVSSTAPAPPARSLRGSETILLVEDDHQVRGLARTILRKHGYLVLDAPSAGDALLICEQFQGKIHLLLTDVVMPRMGGRALVERLAPVRPGMRVIYMSGYTDDAVVRHGGLNAEAAFVEKPIMPEPLLMKIREVLDGPLGS
jgi:two-component system, cell cycle sensor histidine kinase and response regulator CckA